MWSFGPRPDVKARRELAAAALSRIKDPSALRALQKAAGSLIPGVRGAGRRALGTERAA